MNYFEIINSCLLELNYKQADIFENLLKTDHDKIKQIINMVNDQVCAVHDWWFKERKTGIVIPPGTFELENSIDGTINSIYVDNIKYRYYPDAMDFYSRQGVSAYFSLFNGNILLPGFDKEKTATVFYYSNNSAVDEDGEAKDCLEYENDCSLIPEPYVLPILVYGTCMKFKALPSHEKFKFWNAEYVKALMDLRASCIRANEESPRLVIE